MMSLKPPVWENAKCIPRSPLELSEVSEYCPYRHLPGLYGSAKERESQERDGMDYPMPGSVCLGKKKAVEEGPWKKIVVMFLGGLAMENHYYGPVSEKHGDQELSLQRVRQNLLC